MLTGPHGIDYGGDDDDDQVDRTRDLLDYTGVRDIIDGPHPARTPGRSFRAYRF